MTDYCPSVPDDIAEAIIDQLHDEFSTLISCSLVQRSWVSAARAHILNPAIISQFSHDEIPRDNATEFLTLCRSPHSTILPTIKTAVLHIEATTLLEEVVAELAKAAGLRKVIFLDRGLTEATLEKLQQLSNIQEFAYSPFGDFGETEVRLVTSFPRLRTLSIYLTDTVRNITFPPPLPREAGCFTHLRTLRLGLYDPEQLLQWLLDNHPELALETLDLRVLGPPHRGWGSVSALNTFLETQAKTLTDLSLSVEYLFDEKNRTVPVYETINLEPLANLQKLSITTHDIRSIRDSLATISPKTTSLKDLSVGFVGWKGGYGNCDCGNIAENLQMLSDATAEKGPLANTFVTVRLVRYAWRYLGTSFKDRQDKETVAITGLRDVHDQTDSRTDLLQYALTEEEAWRAVYY